MLHIDCLLQPFDIAQHGLVIMGTDAKALFRNLFNAVSASGDYRTCLYTKDNYGTNINNLIDLLSNSDEQTIRSLAYEWLFKENKDHKDIVVFIDYDIQSELATYLLWMCDVSNITYVCWTHDGIVSNSKVAVFQCTDAYNFEYQHQLHVIQKYPLQPKNAKSPSILRFNLIPTQPTETFKKENDEAQICLSYYCEQHISTPAFNMSSIRGGVLLIFTNDAEANTMLPFMRNFTRNVAYSHTHPNFASMPAIYRSVLADGCIELSMDKSIDDCVMLMTRSKGIPIIFFDQLEHLAEQQYYALFLQKLSADGRPMIVGIRGGDKEIPDDIASLFDAVFFVEWGSAQNAPAIIMTDAYREDYKLILPTKRQTPEVDVNTTESGDIVLTVRTKRTNGKAFKGLLNVYENKVEITQMAGATSITNFGDKRNHEVVL